MSRLMAATAVALTLAAYGMAEAKTFRFSSSGDINGLGHPDLLLYAPEKFTWHLLFTDAL